MRCVCLCVFVVCEVVFKKKKSYIYIHCVKNGIKVWNKMKTTEKNKKTQIDKRIKTDTRRRRNKTARCLSSKTLP